MPKDCLIKFSNNISSLSDYIAFIGGDTYTTEAARDAPSEELWRQVIGIAAPIMTNYTAYLK